MKTLKRILLALVLLVGGWIGLAYLLPGTYVVSRSTLIEAPRESVWPLVANLDAWPEWGVWFERDPDMDLAYSMKKRGEGATLSWQSETEGNGRVEVLTYDAYKGYSYELTFEAWDMRAIGTFTLNPYRDGAATRIIWTDTGDLGYNPLLRWLGLFLDGMIGPDFEAGLANLKERAEQRAAANDDSGTR
ncbi:MAG: SRPBCC family protein [Opitutales bacterium]